MRSAMHRIGWLLLTVVLMFADQYTKYWVNTRLRLNETVPLMPHLNLTLRYNTGAAFSLLAGHASWHVGVLTLVSLIASIVLLVWFLKTDSRHRTRLCGIAMVLAGAIGNGVDRAYAGFVTDMFDFTVGTWHFATFNVADAAVSVGVVFLLIDAFFLKHS